jgi:hypothetical protein
MAVVSKPHYLPDLAPCAFFLFPRIKSQLWGHNFQSKNFMNTQWSSYMWFQKVIDFRLLPRCWWNLRSSGVLHGVVW